MGILDRLSNRLFVTVGSRLKRAESGIASATLPEFSQPAPGLVIREPREIANPQRIRIGRDVKIGPNSVIKATTRFPGSWLRHPDGDHAVQEFEPSIVLGDRVTATWGLQIVAFERITIEDDAMFAGNIYISDGQHGTSRGDLPYKYQGIEGVAPIRIGRGCWIGQNVVILPGTSIGEYSIIGANSVVSSHIPPGSLAAGTPAKILRSWDASAGAWQKASDVRDASGANGTGS